LERSKLLLFNGPMVPPLFSPATLAPSFSAPHFVYQISHPIPGPSRQALIFACVFGLSAPCSFYPRVCRIKSNTLVCGSGPFFSLPSTLSWTPPPHPYCRRAVVLCFLIVLLTSPSKPVPLPAHASGTDPARSRLVHVVLLSFT